MCSLHLLLHTVDTREARAVSLDSRPKPSANIRSYSVTTLPTYQHSVKPPTLAHR